MGVDENRRENAVTVGGALAAMLLICVIDAKTPFPGPANRG
jgi:hypothetical protein